MAKRKKRKKTTAKRKKKTARRTRRSPGTAKRATSMGVNQAVSGLQAHLDQLRNQRNEIDRQIADTEQALRLVGSSPAGGRGAGRPAGRRGRAPRAGSLKDFIEQALAGGGTMAVKDITDAVLAAGYPTKNKTLAKSVGIALTQMPNVEKVGRGQFRLK